MTVADACGVAIVGCGTVGGATAKALTDQADQITQKLGLTLALRQIVDVDLANARRLGC